MTDRPTESSPSPCDVASLGKMCRVSTSTLRWRTLMAHKPRKVQRLSIPLFRASEQRFGLREVGRRKVAVAEPPTVLLRGPKRKKQKRRRGATKKEDAFCNRCATGGRSNRSTQDEEAITVIGDDENKAKQKYERARPRF